MTKAYYVAHRGEILAKMKANRGAYSEEQATYHRTYSKAHYLANKEKYNFRSMVWYAANKEEQTLRRRAIHARPEVREILRQKAVLARFGLTAAEYQALVVKQGGVCAICELPETVRSKTGYIRNLHVDHDHETGRVRGLLCQGCNVGIGALKDDARIIRKAADYLAAHGGPESA